MTIPLALPCLTTSAMPVGDVAPVGEVRLIWATGLAPVVVVPVAGVEAVVGVIAAALEVVLLALPPEETITITTTMTAIRAPMPSSTAPPMRELGLPAPPPGAPAGAGLCRP